MSDDEIIVTIPTPEPVIVESDPEPVGEAIVDALEAVADESRTIDHAERLATLEALLASHTHPEYEPPAEPIIEPISEPIIEAPPVPDDLAEPEPVEDSRPNRSHPLFSRPFGGGGE